MCLRCQVSLLLSTTMRKTYMSQSRVSPDRRSARTLRDPCFRGVWHLLCQDPTRQPRHAVRFLPIRGQWLSEKTGNKTNASRTSPTHRTLSIRDVVSPSIIVPAVPSEQRLTVRRPLLPSERCSLISKLVVGSIYLSEMSGRHISESEARGLLLPYGAIEKIWYSSPTDKEMYRLPEGIWVTFAFFQDCRDAQAVSLSSNRRMSQPLTALCQAFREQYRYHLEQPVLPSESRHRANRPMQAAWSGISPSPPSRVHQRARDRCTIYVGGLPSHVSRDRLEALFLPYGSIRNCELISKGSTNGEFPSDDISLDATAHSLAAQCINVFAFIEFAAESQAAVAIAHDVCLFHIVHSLPLTSFIACF